MRKLWLVFVAATTLVGFACSQDVCSHAQSVGENLEGKACATDGGSTTTNTFDKAKCEQGVASCTDADKDIINKALDCLDDVPKCTAGNELSFTGAILACSNDYTKITTGCASAVFQ